jgi:hypothetical protein
LNQVNLGFHLVTARLEFRIFALGRAGIQAASAAPAGVAVTAAADGVLTRVSGAGGAAVTASGDMKPGFHVTGM